MQFLFLVLAIAVPIIPVYAVNVTPPTDLRSFLGILTGLINILIPLIFGLTFLMIAWGVIKAWVMGDASEEDVDTGKKIAFVGVIALVLMVSIWGIVRLLQNGLFG